MLGEATQQRIYIDGNTFLPLQDALSGNQNLHPKATQLSQKGVGLIIAYWTIVFDRQTNPSLAALHFCSLLATDAYLSEDINTNIHQIWKEGW